MSNCTNGKQVVNSVRLHRLQLKAGTTPPGFLYMTSHLRPFLTNFQRQWTQAACSKLQPTHQCVFLCWYAELARLCRSQHGRQVHHSEEHLCCGPAVGMWAVRTCPVSAGAIHRCLHAAQLLGRLPAGGQVILCCGDGRDEVSFLWLKIARLIYPPGLP